MKTNPSRWIQGARTVAFMFVLTVLFGAAVSALQVFTQPLVERNATLFLKRAVREAAGLPQLADTELQGWYTQAVTGFPADARPPVCYRVAGPDGKAVGYVFVRSGAGLWGQITVAVGVDAMRPELLGLSVLDQNETPGLGARIAEPWFRLQVRGKRAPLRLVPEKTRADDPLQMDAITGATITSTAVRDILNRTLAESTNAVLQAEGSLTHGHR